ncbi:hypothetical protein [Ruegeria sp.]|uniref:hypothetical protein n=1 Tax=Ruegeria sp. TaxID=1879320 RepID=UPI00231FC335|nr:hypothetical protein [Ruegeria sp.]MDA7965848.1 hypothetical protein [Ruegeria sp.]
MRLWATILILSALIGCREEVTVLSPEGIAALVTEDREIEFERFQYTGTASLGTDKTFTVIVPRLGEDTGVWWLEEDKICSRWKTFRQGRLLCAKIGQLPDGTYRALSTSFDSTLVNFRFVD